MSSDVPALQVENMRKRFGAHEVLKGVSLTAREGDVISILGASGSGKTTFLRCINLLETPDDGVVTVAGETLSMRDRRDGRREAADRRQLDRLRSELGMVFQSFNLWSHMTILREPDRGAGQRAEGARAANASRKRARCSTRSASATRPIIIPPISPAASNSAPPSPARSRCAPK